MQNEATPVDRGLSPRQLTAIDALFAGYSCTEIARRLRIDRKTLFRWRQDPVFRDEIRRRYEQSRASRPAPRMDQQPYWLRVLQARAEGKNVPTD